MELEDDEEDPEALGNGADDFEVGEDEADVTALQRKLNNVTGVLQLKTSRHALLTNFTQAMIKAKIC